MGVHAVRHPGATVGVTDHVDRPRHRRSTESRGVVKGWARLMAHGDSVARWGSTASEPAHGPVRSHHGGALREHLTNVIVLFHAGCVRRPQVVMACLACLSSTAPSSCCQSGLGEPRASESHGPEMGRFPFFESPWGVQAGDQLSAFTSLRRRGRTIGWNDRGVAKRPVSNTLDTFLMVA